MILKRTACDLAVSPTLYVQQGSSVVALKTMRFFEGGSGELEKKIELPETRHTVLLTAPINLIY